MIFVQSESVFLKESGMPADYINKFFRMLQDIEVNKDLNKAFKTMHSISNNNRNAISGETVDWLYNVSVWI